MSFTLNSPPVAVGALRPGPAEGGLGRDIDRLSELLRKRNLAPYETFKPAPPPLNMVSETDHSVGTLANFSTLTASLQKLQQDNVDDESAKAAPESVSFAMRALFPLVQSGFVLPESADVSVDQDRELRIVWENGPRFLELVVPPEADASAYIYYSQGNDYHLQRDLALDAILERFNWLSGFSASGGDSSN